MPQTVTITCATEGASIYYTTDGSEPTQSSLLYTAPFTIAVPTTLKAKAFKALWTASETVTSVYLIGTIQEGFVYIPGGTFTMGDTRGGGNSDELPIHSVTLNSFYMGKYEVTQSEYQAIMGSNPSHLSYGIGDNYPVNRVSWYAILKYCNLRSMAEGLTPVYTISGSTNPANWGTVPTSNNSIWNAVICNWSANGYRLPTEAEWEYAARGASNNPDYLYSGSNDINAVAWHSGNNTPEGTKPVGTKAPNEHSLYDMSGNLWEWCWDWYGSSYYSNSSTDNPKGPSSGSGRGLRGGVWEYGAYLCRVAFRNYDNPYGTGYGLGFRLCRSGL